MAIVNAYNKWYTLFRGKITDMNNDFPRRAQDLMREMIRPYRLKVYGFFAITFFAILSQVASPFVIKILIDRLSQGGGIVTQGVWYFAGFFVFLLLLEEWLWRIGEYWARTFKPQMVERVRGLLYEQAMSRNHNFFVNSSSGQLGHWVSQTITTIKDVIDLTMWSVWQSSIALLLSAIFLFISHWLLALIFVVWLTSLMYFIVKRGRKFSELAGKQSLEESRASGLTVDSFSNHLSVRVFNKSSLESRILNTQQAKIIKSWQDVGLYSLKSNIVKGHSVPAASALALSVILWLFGKGEIKLGDIALFISYFTSASLFIWELAWQLNSYYTNFGDINNALNGLGAGAQESTSNDQNKFAQEDHAISLRNVEFEYPDNKKLAVLSSLNLEIADGEKIGIVGHSGAGKSTLVSILLGLYQPTKGELYIGTKKVEICDGPSIRNVVAYVPQDTNLFNRTIRDNIAYAYPKATEQQIVKASKDAQAYEFISKLPNGFDTLIGERGVKLSGGQRQRIAIARALLKDSPILILDEATSALDSVSEQAIQKAFNIAMVDRTSVVIAHRLSTLRYMDRIAVFDKGSIAEIGTHDGLIAKKGIYADLWSRQKDGFLGE
jgi:ATP-binding cassette, subfamily B, bacterial